MRDATVPEYRYELRWIAGGMCYPELLSTHYQGRTPTFLRIFYLSSIHSNWPKADAGASQCWQQRPHCDCVVSVVETNEDWDEASEDVSAALCKRASANVRHARRNAICAPAPAAIEA